MRFDKQLLKGNTDTLVLALLATAPSHGYELAERLRRRSQDIFQLGQGTLYPLLYKLEAKAWIEGTWEASDSGRRRRVYRITPEGSRRLAQRTEQWSRLSRGMNMVLEGLPNA
jgi:PadR family transcriptional regulator